MNFEIRIFPSVQFPIVTAWGEIREEYKRLIKKIDIDHKKYGIFESLYYKNGPRECISNLDSLPLISPEIISMEKNKEILGNEWYVDYVDVKYYYSRVLEFYDSGHIIYWYIDFENEIDYKIDRSWLYESKVRPLSKLDEEKYGNSLDELKYFFELDTDTVDERIDPILILSIIFCNLVDGVIFLYQVPDDYFLADGYYKSEELADLIGLDMGRS